MGTRSGDFHRKLRTGCGADHKYRKILSGDFLSGSSAGQPHDDDPNDRGAETADRYVEGTGLWRRCDRRKISCLRTDVYNLRWICRSADRRKDPAVGDHECIRYAVYRNERISDPVKLGAGRTCDPCECTVYRCGNRSGML